MKTFLLLILILGSPVLSAQTSDYLKKTKETLEKSRAKTLETIDKKYVTALQKMLKRYTKSGSIEGVIAVRAELKKLKGEEKGAEEELEKSKLKILSATWASREHASDVTEKVRALKSKNKLSFTATRSKFGDPQPYNGKWIRVSYQIGNKKINVVSTGEDGLIKIP